MSNTFRITLLAVGCLSFLLVGTAEGTLLETMVDTSAFPTSNQGAWSALSNISFDPAKIISSQSKIKVPSAEQRLLEFGTFTFLL
jgi:hypothetical protein